MTATRDEDPRELTPSTSEHGLVRGSLGAVKELRLGGEERGRVAGLCRTYIHCPTGSRAPGHGGPLGPR